MHAETRQGSLHPPAHQRCTGPARAKPQAQSGSGSEAYTGLGALLRGPGGGATSEERYREKSERPFDHLTYEYAETRENEEDRGQRAQRTM